MSYCTIQQVRDELKSLEDVTQATDTIIQSRIDFAEKIIKLDLNSFLSEAELDALGSTSTILNLLAVYKATEKTLVTYYGAQRKVDDVSDIQYYQNQYNIIIKKVYDGEILLKDSSGSPKSYPARTTDGTLKIYTRKGVPTFINDDMQDAYKDDDTLE